MNDSRPVQTFLEACRLWVCDSYSSNMRYLAHRTGEDYALVSAAITLSSLPAMRDNSLRVALPTLVAGQVQIESVDKDSLLTILTDATSGIVNVDGMRLVLPREGEYRVQSATNERDRWFAPLQFQVFGRAPTMIGDLLPEVDDGLRHSSPPFDGLTDLASWLALRPPDAGYLSTITITVNPPVDIILDHSSLSANGLRLTLHAHPNFDIASIGLAVRAVPGPGLEGRRQVAKAVAWGDVREGRREGTADIALPRADSVLTMLMIGTGTVRRHWFPDPLKAANQRLVAVQQFDRDLRMIRSGLFDATDSAKFEAAVAALLFILGFSSAVQLETDSPDLIVSTPNGRLAILECTIRVADVASKIGKLVDRRRTLAKALQASNHVGVVAAVLVCRLPRDQIAAHATLIRSCGVILVASEELNDGLDRVRLPSDPDLLLNQSLQALASASPGDAGTDAL